MFPKETNFFELLAYAKDLKQKKNIIRFITKSQYNVIINIAQKILNGDIHLKNIQFRILKNKKLFLRKLSEGKNQNKLFTLRVFNCMLHYKIRFRTL